jgi:hypothetical protein
MPAKSIVPNLIVEINEIENGTKFYHNFAFPDIHLDVNTDDGYADLVLPMDFWFLSVEFYAGPGSGAVLGDHISALVSPKLTIPGALSAKGAPATWGNITADITIADEWVSVNSNLIQDEDLRDGFLRIGSHIYFGANASDLTSTSAQIQTPNTRSRITT